MKTYSHAGTEIPVDGLSLSGELTVPAEAVGVVVFVHATGKTHASRRNRFVAGALQEAGFATLLVDLLDEHEARDRHNLFDPELLAVRLVGVVRWLAEHRMTRLLPVCYYGAGTGSAGALIAAARDPERVSAVACRSGRLEMALSYLHRVTAPTLLVVGQLDSAVLGCNQDACRRLQHEKRLVVVPRASHFFAEPGTLDEATRHVCRWFVRKLTHRLQPLATTAQCSNIDPRQSVRRSHPYDGAVSQRGEP